MTQRQIPELPPSKKPDKRLKRCANGDPKSPCSTANGNKITQLVVDKTDLADTALIQAVAEIPLPQAA